MSAMRRIQHRKPRAVTLNQETTDALRGQMEAFKKKFGREPGPDDPLLFDPDAATPQPYPEEKLKQEMATALRMAGIDEARIYATQKTGMLITKENYNLWSKADLEEYRQALEEYRKSLQ
jgi:hypothetical protein